MIRKELEQYIENSILMGDIITEKSEIYKDFLESNIFPYFNVLWMVNSGAFKSCLQLEKVTLPKVEIIEANAFEDCDVLKKLNIPEDCDNYDIDH